jgi:DNA primase
MPSPTLPRSRTRCPVDQPERPGIGATYAPCRENIDVDRLKQSVRLSDIVSRYTQLRPAGHGRTGLCPFHEEKNASFVVSDDVGLYYCHACHAGGDVIDFVKAMNNCSFIDAVKIISGTIVTLDVTRYRQQGRKLEHAKRAVAIAYARFQWQEGVPIEGTPAELYLRSRGIECDIPSSIRYGRPHLWTNLMTGDKGPRQDALIAACNDVSGRITGVQRIFLQPNGTIARLQKPKRNVGVIKGGALRLGPEGPEIIVCEGPEDGLTLAQTMPSTPVCVSLGSGNMAAMILPPGVKRILVAGDNNQAGRMAARLACDAFRSQGRQATPIFPDANYEDFNDQLRDRRIASPAAAEPRPCDSACQVSR